MHDIFTHDLVSERWYHDRMESTSSTHRAADCLLEDLAISPLVGLAANSDRLVPRPLVLYEFLVLGLAGVKFGEFVALPVGCDVEGGESFVAADHEGTFDDGVVGLAVDGGRAEEVLAGSLETVEETTWCTLVVLDVERGCLGKLTD